MSHQWQPIQDLPKDWGGLTEGELKPLLRFWNDQRADLEARGVLGEFSQRLAREWSIETGQIEGVYNIERGVTQTLIERGINADLIPPEPGQKTPELIATIIRDHQDVLEGLFQFVRGDRAVSKSYINELHAALLRHQDSTTVVDQFGTVFPAQLVKGAYKQRPNNPLRPDGTVHQYCPPEHVEAEMDRLLLLHKQHSAMGIPVEVEAAWFHHRFTQIHPYQDGNGRVARALASLGFLKDRWFPVVVTREDRSRYIDALEVADAGDLRSLVAFFVDVQKRALFQATQAAADVEEVKTVDDAVSSIKRVLTAAKSLDPKVWLLAKENASRLIKISEDRLEKLVRTLQTEVGKDRQDFTFSTSSGSNVYISPTDLGYKANTHEYEMARQMWISQKHQVIVEVNAHAIGSKFRGLIGIAVAVRGHRPEILHGELASKESFQVNYAEPLDSTERRFRTWLEESLVKALTIWRKSL